MFIGKIEIESFFQIKVFFFGIDYLKKNLAFSLNLTVLYNS